MALLNQEEPRRHALIALRHLERAALLATLGDAAGELAALEAAQAAEPDPELAAIIRERKQVTPPHGSSA